MDIEVLRKNKDELEAALAATLHRFEEDTGAIVDGVSIKPIQDFERIDDNTISIAGNRWFRVKVTIQI